MSGELKPPIILFGNFHSGTTMLQKLIAAHPDVVSLYEPVGLWLYADPDRILKWHDLSLGSGLKLFRSFVTRWSDMDMKFP
jgi:hypothetical protein